LTGYGSSRGIFSLRTKSKALGWEVLFLPRAYAILLHLRRKFNQRICYQCKTKEIIWRDSYTFNNFFPNHVFEVGNGSHQYGELYPSVPSRTKSLPSLHCLLACWYCQLIHFSWRLQQILLHCFADSTTFILDSSGNIECNVRPKHRPNSRWGRHKPLHKPGLKKLSSVTLIVSFWLIPLTQWQ
jgi:hypothetical protein